MADATSIHGIPISAPPANPFAPEAMPSGDTADGIGLFLDPATCTLNWKQAHINHGPSSLLTNTNLPGRAWTQLGGPINYATFGFREQLVSYPPAGVWELDGRVVIAGPTNVEYVVKITQGTALSSDPGRAGLLTEAVVIVGGGVQTWTGPAYMPFSIPIAAHDINCATAPGQATELLVWVYPKIDDSAGAAALAVIGADSAGGGALPTALVSSFVVRRVRR